jgi:hypothetical protein
VRFKHARSLVTFVILVFVLISLQSDKLDRYLLPILPHICIVAGFGLDKIIRDFKRFKYLTYAAAAIVVLFVAFTFYNDAAPLITSRAQTFCGFDKVGSWLNQNTESDDWLLVGSGNQLYWYADRDNIRTFPKQVDDFYTLIANQSFEFIVVDRWERVQPNWVFQFTDEGQFFWYPNFLNDSRFPIAQVVTLDEQPVAFIYSVNI